MRDKSGNISGIVGNYAFISDNNGNITFYSRPEPHESYHYYPPLRSDNYDYWFTYDEIRVPLGPFKSYFVEKPEVKEKYAFLSSEEKPTTEKIEETRKSLPYTKIDELVCSKRSQITKK